MSSIWITYTGFFIAVFIIVWVMAMLGRRSSKRKKVDASVIHSWVPLSPSTIEGGDAEQGDGPQIDPHPRSEQNGHYSESKKK